VQELQAFRGRRAGHLWVTSVHDCRLVSDHVSDHVQMRIAFQVFLIVSKCRLQLCSSVSRAARRSNTYESVQVHMAVDV
jgi:hypothetical protein